MKITRTSPRTGKNTTLDLDITQAQFKELSSPTRRSIQNIFPDLSRSECEFLLTGYTDEDWAAIFPPRPEEVLP